MSQAKPQRLLGTVTVGGKDVRRRQQTGHAGQVLLSVPFQPYPADPLQPTRLGQILQDGDLGAFAVELEQVHAGEARLGWSTGRSTPSR